VARCGIFTRTAEAFDEAERDIHNENLSGLLNIFSAFNRERTQLQIVGYVRQGKAWARSAYDEAIFDPNPESPNNHHRALTRNDIYWYKWISSLRKMGNEPPPHNKFFHGSRHTVKRHISVCNDMAKGEKTLVLVSGPSGATIGTCSADVQVGDKVLLVSGVSLPLITRIQPDSSHRLISPCRLVGIMNGEYWNINWEGEDLEEFIVC
jgi:hypothetical protein